jgi:deoxyadenosine/deoxycytidine kinase
MDIENFSQIKAIIESLNIEIKIISIEGNIGSGKSTLVNMLQYYFNNYNRTQHIIQYHFIEEPVKEWEKIKDKTNENKNMLQLFYENQNKYSFVFQITAYITRLSNLKNKIDEIIKNRMKQLKERNPFNSMKTVKHIIITERSLKTDKYVFAQMMYDDGKINEIEWQSYNHWFNIFVNEYSASHIIYVNTTVETCYERAKQRNRNGEEDIPIEYLEKCHEYHTKLLSQYDEKSIYYFDSEKKSKNIKLDIDYIKDVLNFIYNYN